MQQACAGLADKCEGWLAAIHADVGGKKAAPIGRVLSVLFAAMRPDPVCAVSDPGGAFQIGLEGFAAHAEKGIAIQHLDGRAALVGAIEAQAVVFIAGNGKEIRTDWYRARSVAYAEVLHGPDQQRSLAGPGTQACQRNGQ